MIGYIVIAVMIGRIPFSASLLAVAPMAGSRIAKTATWHPSVCLAVSEETVQGFVDANKYIADELEKDDWKIQEMLQLALAQEQRDREASRQTCLAEEEKRDSKQSTLPVSWKSHVCRVLMTEAPILTRHDCQRIIDAARDYWRHDEDEQVRQDNERLTASSSFTFQSANKREVHTSELLDWVATNISSDTGYYKTSLTETVNTALTDTIYPMLRNAFPKDLDSVDTLYLYDSLIIEYDATRVTPGLPLNEYPSQPLHRDLGLLSVNIALNDPSEFQGGGTVMERLLEDSNHPSILPLGAGYAIAHPSRERHAGGGLLSGKRTILVCFVAADRGEEPHPCQWAARCKGLATQAKSTGLSFDPTPTEYRRVANQATLVKDPNDGEAYLGWAMSLLSETPMDHHSILKILHHAKDLIPQDGRVHNTLGIAWKRLWESQQDSSSPPSNEYVVLYMIHAWKQAIHLHRLAAMSGCQGSDQEYRSALFNLGLWYANQDDFGLALKYLAPILEGPLSISYSNEPESAKEYQSYRVWKDAQSLSKFCSRQQG